MRSAQGLHHLSVCGTKHNASLQQSSVAASGLGGDAGFGGSRSSGSQSPRNGSSGGPGGKHATGLKPGSSYPASGGPQTTQCALHVVPSTCSGALRGSGSLAIGIEMRDDTAERELWQSTCGSGSGAVPMDEDRKEATSHMALHAAEQRQALAAAAATYDAKDVVGRVGGGSTGHALLWR